MWRFQPFNEILDGPLATPRLTALPLGGFAIVALMLCAVRLNGVTSFSVRQQTREIGIRMTPGAPPIACETAMGTVALWAAYLPARRATRIDPVEALRAQ